ncbi:hypothetical protein [Streptomyces sp. NPDC094149]|uniref:hypothetical protein n=1 Tax=Streptomyces sp. NPDC094149 TaxID=3155079 RepID=UPI00331F6827
MAINVGSVEVDVVPNAQGIEGRLRAALVPPARQIGDEVGRIIGRQIATQLTSAVRDGINAGGRAARPAAARQGDETAGAFSRSLKARLEAAFRSLPKADVGLSTTGFDADMARLRARLETLSGKRIGIDVDAATALAEITDVEARLRRLGAEHPNVQVRADTAAALAQLAALRAEVDAVDGKNVDIDASSATGSINGLVFAALALGPALIPVLPVIAAGLGAVAAAGTAAAAGVGAGALVAIPAFKQIGSVLQAQKAATDAATNATLRGGQANSAGASKALQMAGAQQALATARRNAARQIADAERGVSDAVRQAAQANAQAAAQVKQARQSVADAYAQAAERMQQANQQVASAERDLAQAQKTAVQAQKDLTAARAQAVRELQDMNNSLADAQLSQRQAELDLADAKRQRDAVFANSSSTDEQRARAQLAYDQALQSLKEQQLQTQRLKKDTAAANKAGVDGSKTVQSAQQQLAQAQQDVTDKTAALKTAQQNIAKTQIQNTRAIADAQEKLSEAQKNVAETQRQGAESIARAQERVVQAQQSAADSVASAQRQIASASQSAAGGVDQAAIAQAKYQQALAKLTPSARDTLNAFLDLRTAFGAWSKSLQPAVMPIFTRALVSLRNTLPTLTPFVQGAATAIKGLQDRASASVKSPFWQGFKQDLQTSVIPAITGLGVAFGNVVKGMAGIVDAFLPHMSGISSTLQRITGRFANWGANLKGSPEFERFLSYAAEHGPVLARVLGQIFTAFLNVSKALSPIGDVILPLLGGLAEAIGIIADKAPWFIQLIYGIILATKLWTLAQIAFNFVMSANPLVLIGLAILALVGFVIYAYNKFGWFRDLVQTVWSAIQTAAMFAWNNILKPVFSALVQAVQMVGRWAMWLWNNAIKPAWAAISIAARILITAIVVAFILPAVAAFKILGAIASWLWTNAIKPAFDAIASIARWLWTNVFKPVFQQIGDKAKWLYRNAIKPSFDFTVAAAKAMWETYLKPILKAFWGGLQTLGGWAKWLYKNAMKPSFDAIVDVGKKAWKYGIKPIFDGWKNIIKGLGGVFRDAVGAIKSAWDKVKDVAKKPVQFIVDTVYNHGILGVWNKVASAFGAPKLKSFHFASGGIMPGYTPGRDVHKFLSPTGGALELSGGEAIMRPEFTRAVGSGFVSTMNSIARSRGSQGVKAALAPVFGGSAPTSTDRSLRYAGGGVVQSFANGGIFGWIGKGINKVAGAGSAIWNKVKEGASWLKDTLEASARAGVKNVVNPLLDRFPGMDTGFGRLVRRIPDKILDAMFGFSKGADKKGAGGLGGPRIQAALKWAKSQNGLPYQWAGNGNPSWDCSGFMSAIESVIRGQKPHRRWATMAFQGKTAPPGWVYHGNSPFKIGVTNSGVGHTAGTLAGVNVESSGGRGVHYGHTARGYKDPLFGSWYGFQPGKYDSGGYLQPGFNLAYNGTGRPEPVFTTQQANALTSLAAGGGVAGPARFEGDLYLDSGEFLGRVRGEAQQVVSQNNRQLVTALNARPRR